MKDQVEQQFRAVSESAAAACPKVRVLRRIEVGQAIHQGDVYMHRVADDHPRGDELGTCQVAVGDTQGSRHVAEGEVHVFAGVALPATFQRPAWIESDEQARSIFLGPVVVADAPWCLTHPEHAHHRLPAGAYQVTYQADQMARARVAD